MNRIRLILCSDHLWRNFAHRQTPIWNCSAFFSLHWGFSPLSSLLLPSYLPLFSLLLSLPPFPFLLFWFWFSGDPWLIHKIQGNQPNVYTPPHTPLFWLLVFTSSIQKSGHHYLLFLFHVSDSCSIPFTFLLLWFTYSSCQSPSTLTSET